MWCLDTGVGIVQGREAPLLRLYKTWISGDTVYVDLDSQRVL
ncbi:MAG: hypothetical protein QW086_06590 [Pyrobaculum sp.]